MIYTVKGNKKITVPYQLDQPKDKLGTLVKDGDYILTTTLCRYPNMYISKVEHLVTDQDSNIKVFVFKSLQGQYLNLQWREFIICTPEMLKQFEKLIVK